MEKFNKPEITIIKLDVEDVVVTSGCEFGELDCEEF